MTSHSLFSASAAHRWVRCPGSVALSQGIKDTGSPAAAEGTFLHSVLAWCLENSKGVEAWDGAFLNQEQEDAVRECIEYVNAIPGAARFFEMRAAYGESLNLPDGIAYGTLDVAVVDSTTLHIMDAKFGRHHVEAKGNFQMLLYAMGVASAMQSLHMPVDKIIMHIIQPRTTGTNEPWEITRQELGEWATKFALSAEVVMQALDNHNPSSKAWQDRYLDATPEACRWCLAKAICPAIRAEADTAMDMARSADVGEFDEDKLSEALRMAPLLEAFIDAVRKEAIARLGNNKPVAGFKLIQGRAGNRKWRDDDDLVAKFLRKIGLDECHAPAKVLTPAQAEHDIAKMLAEANDTTIKVAKTTAAEMMDEAVTRNPGKPSLVTDDTPGSPWSAGADLEEFD